ncbi:MAG TPA: protein-export chaperone SecB [Oceanospirillales bacterium]|nr:protein-export chaperone SecB [Oceanospirillaceae bacterium]HBS42194.1 protein-export chaperone SecB [Oceanospirillales bacterium]|tara:strand:- start:7617 stop:8093 length:477 start_codon:yes stop_codon:yes gene_type:complete
MSENQQQQFALQRIYLRDASFEAPNLPDTFRKAWKPEIKLDLGSVVKTLEEGQFEVTLKATVTAKLEDETAFLVELEQCGLFIARNIPEQQMGPVLGIMCPNMLFPYLRENVDSLVIKGGFPALMLAPVNFEALYHKKMQEVQQAQQQQGDAEAEQTH